MHSQSKQPLSVCAASIVGLLSISPLAIALDSFFPFLPDRPVFEYMRSASVVYRWSWATLAPLGFITILVLRSRPIKGAALVLFFTAAYVPLALIIWRHFTWGCWLAGFGLLLAVGGAFIAWRSNNSFKPSPLRGPGDMS